MKHTISCYGTSLSADTRGAELCSYTDVHGCERLWEGDPSDFGQDMLPYSFQLLGLLSIIRFVLPVRHILSISTVL